MGPICLLVFINLFILIMAIRAAFTLQDHVLGFGNLRTLLWVSVVALPLLGATWILALLAASERHPLLTPFLSAAVLIHAAFSLAGYCFANNRVRQNLIRSIMRCMGKKVPLLDTTSVVGVPSTSSQNISGQSVSVSMKSRFSFYRLNCRDQHWRTIQLWIPLVAILASRPLVPLQDRLLRPVQVLTGNRCLILDNLLFSFCRSDTHLRHTSTSTSNYNSTSDVPSYMRGFEQETGLHRHRELPEESERRERRADSDSDSDGSEGRSLDLASSHSSDDDESSTRRHRARGTTSGRQGYLPNITEHVVSRCGTPPSLNVVTNSQLFPAVQPSYGSRWSSQLPEAYLPNPNGTNYHLVCAWWLNWL